MTTEIVFECYKCQHRLHLGVEDIRRLLVNLEKLAEMDCPECGEEGHLNWKLSHIVT